MMMTADIVRRILSETIRLMRRLTLFAAVLLVCLTARAQQPE